MTEEIQFNKYKKRGSDYHYRQADILNPFKFNAFVKARYLKHIKILENLLKKNVFNPKKTLNILDVGCGDGVLLFLLKKHLKNYHFNLYGIDLSEEAILTAKIKLHDARFFVSGVYETKFENDFFDILISSDVIEHVNHPEKMLSEINRITKNNAPIVIGTPVRYTEKPLDKMHVKEFFQDEFKELMLNYFSEVEIIESHKLIHLLRYRKTLNIFTKKIRANRYFYYLLSLFKLNPFLIIPKNTDLSAYMFATAINKK